MALTERYVFVELGKRANISVCRPKKNGAVAIEAAALRTGAPSCSRDPDRGRDYGFFVLNA